MGINFRRCKNCKHCIVQEVTELPYCHKRQKPIFWDDFLCRHFERKDEDERKGNI